MSQSGKLINKLLEIQNQLKLYHWQTTSYPRHIASDKFVAKASAIIDRIVEVYQGSRKRVKVTEPIKLKNLTDKDVVKYLQAIKDFFLTDYLKYLTKDDVDLLTIRDEMVENINQTLYLFSLK